MRETAKLQSSAKVAEARTSCCLWWDDRGSFAPIAAIVMAVLLGFGALTIDMGFGYFSRNKLQMTADATALAAVSQLPDQVAMVVEALDYAEKNMPAAEFGTVLANGDVVAGNWDPDTRTFTPALDPINAVMTTTRQDSVAGNAAPAFLGGIAGLSQYDIVTSSIATQGIGADLFPSGCIMALNETEEEAFYIFGTATVTATDCSIEVASTADCAMYAHGTPTITRVDGDGTSGISVAGTYCERGTVDINPPPNEDYAGDISDPYRNTDPCEQGLNCSAPCDYVDATFTDSAVAPAGVYCGGISWTGSGTATFAGDYIIREGALDIGGNVSVDGNAGVGFYLQGTGSVVSFQGTSSVALVAQDNGSALDGFIFFEEEKSPQETHVLRGTNGGGYDGVLYFDGDVELKGTADSGLAGESDCTVLIADTVYFNGTTGLDANATCAGDGPSLPPGVGDLVVRLVE